MTRSITRRGVVSGLSWLNLFPLSGNNSAQARNTFLTYDVMSYGAVGNGESNPASSRYANIKDLQAVFGRAINGIAVTLTQELDWLATQTAINAASTTGGVVYSVGNFVYSNATSVTDQSGTLLFPNAYFGTDSHSVSWQGNLSGSVHRWPVDLGIGRPAILCDGRPDGNSVGFLRDLILVGPGCGSVLGASSCLMQGIMTNSRRVISSMWIYGFWCGINLIGGQTSHTDIFMAGNYYGYYFDTPSSSNFGNMLFSRVVCDLSSKAAIGINHSAVIPSSLFISCFFGTAPFSIFKETNGGAPAQPLALSGCEFENTQFENFGNAMISDDGQNYWKRKVGVYNTQFRRCQFMWDTYVGLNFRLPNTIGSAIFDVGVMMNVDIDGIVQPEQMLPGSIGIFSTTGVVGLRIRGDIDTLIRNCNNTVAPRSNQFFNCWIGGASDVRLEHIGNSGWSGSTATSQGAALLNGVITQSNAELDHFQISAGTAADAVLGILKYDPNPGFAGQNCIYADQGIVQVCVDGAVAIGQFIRSSANGHAVVATNINDPTSSIIGVAVSVQAMNICTVRLRGLH